MCGIGEEHGAFERDYAFWRGRGAGRLRRRRKQATFQGYKRDEWAGRDAQLCRHPDLGELLDDGGGLHRQGDRAGGILDDYPNIDGIVALKQANGCVIDYRGVIFDTLKKTTWGYATNPNMGGVIMVGLGCEGFQIPQAQGSLRRHRERDVPHDDHPGSRRHEEDGRRPASRQ